MYQEERLLGILEYLKSSKEMSVHDICSMFDVSRDTARRDILKLVEEQAVIRTHGGITLPELRERIKDYRNRLQANSEEKKSIADKALMFVYENGHYFFDVSTTIGFLSKNIDKSVTVYTHSLDNIEILSEKPSVSVYSIGGCLNKANRFFYESDFKNLLEGVRFDAAFLGAAAIREDGIYYADKEDAFMKQNAVKQSEKVIVLADFEKYEKKAYYRGVNWDVIDVFITDKTPPDKFVDIMKSHDIDLIIV